MTYIEQAELLGFQRDVSMNGDENISRGLDNIED